MKQITSFFSSIDRNTWIIIGVVVLIIIIVIVVNKRNKTTTTTLTTTTPVNQASFVPTSTGNNFPLQYGSRGDNIAKWQKYLNTKGAGLKEDGVWGPLTEAASLKYMGFNSVTKEYFDAVIK